MAMPMPEPEPESFPYIALPQETVTKYFNHLEEVGGPKLKSFGVVALDLYNSRKIAQLWQKMPKLKGRLFPDGVRPSALLYDGGFICGPACAVYFPPDKEPWMYALCVLFCLYLFLIRERKRKKP
jgi:hypothetical protein